MKKEKLKDLLIISLIPLVSFILILLFDFKINYLASLLLIYGIPSLYLSVKNKNKIKKAFGFSFLVSIPVSIIIYTIARLDNAWYVPSTIFPFRLINTMTIEDFIWMFLSVYLVVIFYENFFMKKRDYELSKRMVWFFYIFIPLTLAVVFIYFLNSDFLNFPYAYLLLGIVIFLIPVVLFLIKNKKYIRNFFLTSLYIAPVFLIVELIGVKYGHWVFEGAHYIGWISLFNIQFPFEEFFFVIVLGAFAGLSYYEFFAEKHRK